MGLTTNRKSLVIYLITAFGVTAAIVTVAVLVISHITSVNVEDVLIGYKDESIYTGITIVNPLNETLFPPEIAPPTFRWKDDNPESNTWLITIKFKDEKERINFLVSKLQWTPKTDIWETIKKRTLNKNAEVTVLGVSRSIPVTILSGGRISISTSKDEVGAPIFYREVNLPFIDAVKDPSRIRWRFGTISSLRQPQVVLEGLPVCGNCHSFSENGETLAMDVDYANSKGSYVITPVAKEMILATSDIITWDDYKREDGEPTFGLLSQISPDGKVVVSTVKDESVFVPKPGMAFSQLFFPIKGILSIYDRESRTFRSLPGADDPNYVQSNPSWSPDGKYIVFARSKAYQLRSVHKDRSVLLSPEECAEFLKEGKIFQFDLYRIPYNNGNGGEPEPLEGASNNGMSNYFAKYSPDGKWIIFCKAKSYMLLQPDSELYIIPSEGGKPRRLQVNTNRMNSWHSWSPNGKWLVFTSKANTVYTQLFLTHINEEGYSSPPVLLERFTNPDRAANIPEFVNTHPSAIRNIRERFIDDVSYVRAAREFLKANDYGPAIRQCQKALSLNPKNPDAHRLLGLAFFGSGKNDQAFENLSKAVEMNPRDAEAHTHLGTVLMSTGKLGEAIKNLNEAIRLDPNNPSANYNFGVAMFRLGRIDEAIKYWSHTIRLEPKDSDAHYSLALVMLRRKNFNEAIKHLLKVVDSVPEHAEAHHRLGLALIQQNNMEKAITHLSKAARLKSNNVNIHYNLALALASQKKTGEAIHHLSEAVKIMPDHVEARYNLGVMLFRKGETDKAIKHWLEVVRLNANHVDSMLCLGEAYAKKGQFSKAIMFMEKAITLARNSGQIQRVQQMQQRLEFYKQKSIP